MYLYFKGLQTLSEKRKYNPLHSDRYIYKCFYIVCKCFWAFWGCLRFCRLSLRFCRVCLRFCRGYLSKNANYLTLRTLNPWILAYYLPLLKVLLQVKRTQTHTKKHHERDCKPWQIEHLSTYSQPFKLYKKSLFCRFSLRKYGENTFEDLQKGAFWGFWLLRGQTKGAKGGGLNAWTPERIHAERTDKPRHAQR